MRWCGFVVSACTYASAIDSWSFLHLLFEIERARCLCLGVRLQRVFTYHDFASSLVHVWCASVRAQLVGFAFILGDGAGQVPVPWSEIAERIYAVTLR